ncbi:hypothetical protein BH09MYX1_BH09MYX1_40960 [soil metagenome]
MSAVVVLAHAALSGLGRGEAAASAGNPGELARVAPKVDDELSAAGLSRPFAARVAGLPGEGDRATSILRAAFGDLMARLDAIDPSWKTRRIGVALATSSGGMRSAEELFRVIHREEKPTAAVARAAQYFSPTDEVLAELPFTAQPFSLVLTACAASTIALGLAQSWLRSGACDLAFAGGFDAVSVFVASGFEALRATTASLPSRPFAKDRDGMALGEGAALIALVREEDAPVTTARIYLDGFGASGDAIHVTAPDRTGDGLARAALDALGDAPRSAITLVSAHGTATPFNDSAESKATRRALDPFETAVVHPFKAQIGHTLGAAGALESLVVIDALTRDVAPASVHVGERDPEAPVTLLQRAEAREIGSALKLSAAFGGANAAIVWSRKRLRSPLPDTRPVFVSRAVAVEGVPTATELVPLFVLLAEKIARADAPFFVALAALAKLRALGLDLTGAGIVVGHAYANLDVNEQYNRRILQKNARLVEARRFPYTSPNATCGECSLAFKLTGPNLAVGAGLHGAIEALADAATLVRGGHADRIVVVAVDAPERAAIASAEAAGWPLPRAGAVALLVSHVRETSDFRELASAWASSRGASLVAPLACGHESLLALVSQPTGALEISVRSPSGGAAFVDVRE